MTEKLDHGNMGEILAKWSMYESTLTNTQIEIR